MKTVGRNLICAVFLVCLPKGILAQDSLATPSHIWLGFDIGPFMGNHTGGTIRGLTLSLTRNYLIYTVRVLTAQKPQTAVLAFNQTVHNADSFSGDPDDLLETSALFGLVFKKHLFLFSASVGLGYVIGDVYGDASPPFGLFGFPYDIQIGLCPTPVLGISLYVFGNVNKAASYQGVIVCIQIGKLW